MTHRTPAEVSELFVERISNARDLSALDLLFNETSITHQLRSAPGDIPAAPRTPAHLREELEGWFAAFPDIRVSVEQRMVAGSTVTCRYRMDGTHQATWFGIPARGTPVVIRMVHTQRVHEGRVAEDWLLADWYGVLEQLGVLPSLADLLASARSSG